jgi:hypothetical protein
VWKDGAVDGEVGVLVRRRGVQGLKRKGATSKEQEQKAPGSGWKAVLYPASSAGASKGGTRHDIIIISLSIPITIVVIVGSVVCHVCS